jgi:hypothetical protein
MAILFKEKRGIPLQKFQIKLSCALNLIGSSVQAYPKNPIKEVFAASREIEQGNIEHYFLAIKSSIDSNTIDYKCWVDNFDDLEIWTVLQTGIFYKLSDEELELYTVNAD